jgi:hypothetical protein
VSKSIESAERFAVYSDLYYRKFGNQRENRIKKFYVAIMTIEQILETLPHLSFDDRLKIATAAFDSLQSEHEQFRVERSKRLALSALKMREEYETNPELTLVTALDDEDIYEYTDEDWDRLSSDA